MTFIKNFFASLKTNVKPALLRFPAVYFLTFCFTVVASINTLSPINIFDDISIALFLCALLGFCVQLVAEKLFFERKKTQLILQAISVFCVIPIFFLYKNFQQTHLAIFSIFIALLFLCPFLLSLHQEKNKVVLNIFSAGIAAFIIMMCVGCALSIIFWTLSELLLGEILNIGDIYSIIWGFSFFVVFLDTFVAYSSKKSDEIKIPKLCKIAILHILFPLYLLLLFVLYCYLAKSIITLSLPMREANTFISFATALYLLFFLTLPYYDCKATRIFKKFGSLALIPLVIVQIIISVDRIHAHGISQNRYAVVMYTIFTICVIAFSFIKNGRNMLTVCPILSGLCLFSGLSPLNIENVPLWSQTRIMEAVLNEHNLIVDGKIDAQKAAQVLSNSEREILSRAYGKIADIEKRPVWFAKDSENKNYYYGKDFEKTFGFRIGEEINVSYYFKLNVPTSYKFNFSDCSEFYLLKQEKEIDSIDSKEGTVKYAEHTFDLSQALKIYLQQSPNNYNERITAHEPIYIEDSYGFTLVLTYVSIDVRNVPVEKDVKSEEFKLSSANIQGFAFK